LSKPDLTAGNGNGLLFQPSRRSTTKSHRTK